MNRNEMMPEKSKKTRADIMPQVAPPSLSAIPEGYVTIGTSLEQVVKMLEYEDWAEEWYSRNLFEIEQPQHQLYVEPYEIGTYPITNTEYFTFAWATGHRVPRYWHGFRYADAIKDHPVVGVSHEDAIAYCKWLSEQTNMAFRLPTEVEWERAARGDDDRIYPWGEKFENWRCNTQEGSKRTTTPVGTYSPGGDSPFNVADLAGNVWEWTNSVMEAYPYDAQDGREVITPESHCVLRGGAFYYSRKLARCSSREWVLPSYVSPLIGFRVVHTPESEAPNQNNHPEP